MLKGMGHMTLLECEPCDSQRIIFQLLEETFPSDTFEAFLHGSIFDKTAFFQEKIKVC